MSLLSSQRPVSSLGRRAASGGASKISLRDAINTAIDEEMERDDKVFIMGEKYLPCSHRCVS